MTFYTEQYPSLLYDFKSTLYISSCDHLVPLTQIARTRGISFAYVYAFVITPCIGVRSPRLFSSRAKTERGRRGRGGGRKGEAKDHPPFHLGPGRPGPPRRRLKKRKGKKRNGGSGVPGILKSFEQPTISEGTLRAKLLHPTVNKSRP